LVRVAVLFVLPFADPNLSDGLILGYQSWGTYLHHFAVGGATALYVGGMPWLVSRLGKPESPIITTAPAATP
jgi:hypothetical protein